MWLFLEWGLASTECNGSENKFCRALKLWDKLLIGSLCYISSFMSRGFVHRSNYMTLSTDRCLRLCFCLYLRDSDSFVNIDKASIKNFLGKLSRVSQFLFTTKWQTAGPFREITLDFVLLAHLERLPYPSFICQHQVPVLSAFCPNS